MQTIRNVNIIVNAILIVHAMLHLSVKDKINLPDLAMDAAIIINADLIFFGMVLFFDVYFDSNLFEPRKFCLLPYYTYCFF